MGSQADISRLEAWQIAIRPQTLPAGLAPVLVGTAVAVADGVFAPGPAMAALIGALFIQIGTNLANDYYDAMRGVDTEDRTGFTRVTHAGLIPPSRVRGAMAATFLAAILVGTYLVYIGGLPIVIVGLVSIGCGIAYAGGPFPFGSYGLGDLFVFVFFGLVAVTGTYYVQAVAILAEQPFPLGIPDGTVTAAVLLASLPMAALSTAILVVNNLRDIETDREAGKYTLAVLIGPTLTRVEYACLMTIAYVIPFVFLALGWGLPVLLPVASLPLAALLLRTVMTTRDGTRLNRALERTGQVLLIYALLFSIGVVLA